MRLPLRCLVLLAVLAAGCSCGEVHQRDAGADAPGPDVLWDDGGTDAEATDGGEALDGECERIAGFRRCDDRCPVPCTAATGRCQPIIGVCAGAPGEPSSSCQFTPTTAGEYCTTGGPCAASVPLATMCPAAVPGGPPLTYCGPCMPAEFCIASRGAGLPPFQCVWSDGTDVVTGPPAGSCPPSPDGVNPFCGGSCGAIDCPAVSSYHGCVGVSDVRNFGVCEVIAQRCNETDVPRTLALLSTCASATGQACACLVPSPLPAGTTTRFGFPVLRSMCLAYRGHFPGNADCVDESWTTIP